MAVKNIHFVLPVSTLTMISVAMQGGKRATNNIKAKACKGVQVSAVSLAMAAASPSPDPDSHTGYTVRPDFTAYHGWAEVPEW